MPWKWGNDKFMSIEHGGDVGTSKNAKKTTTWPKYERQYLQGRLEKLASDTNSLGPAETLVYLNKSSDKYKQEAEEELKNEFHLWLEGRHMDNTEMNTYQNNDIKPKRRHVFEGILGTEKDDWKPTFWGKSQLTHLPGVREYLRANAIKAESESLKMNLLAEFGPQNLEEAWMYFKHWVKGQPLTDVTYIMTAKPADNYIYDEIGQRSDIMNVPPENLNRSYKAPSQSNARTQAASSSQPSASTSQPSVSTQQYQVAPAIAPLSTTFVDQTIEEGKKTISRADSDTSLGSQANMSGKLAQMQVIPEEPSTPPSSSLKFSDPGPSSSTQISESPLYKPFDVEPTAAQTPLSVSGSPDYANDPNQSYEYVSSADLKEYQALMYEKERRQRIKQKFQSDQRLFANDTIYVSHLQKLIRQVDDELVDITKQLRPLRKLSS